MTFPNPAVVTASFIDLAATGPIRFAATQTYGPDNLPQIYALSRDARRVARFDYAAHSAKPAAISGVLPGRPLVGVLDYSGDSVTPTQLWIQTVEGTLLELAYDTLAVQAVYGKETFGCSLSEVASLRATVLRGHIGSPTHRYVFLQGRPGEILAWNVTTKVVDFRCFTGLSDLAVAVNIYSSMGNPQTAIMYEISAVCTAGQTVIPINNTRAPYGSPGPVYPNGQLYAHPWVTQNGGLLRLGIDYTVGSVTDPPPPYITLLQPAAAGDVVVFRNYLGSDFILCADSRGRVTYLRFNVDAGFEAGPILTVPGLVDIQDAFHNPLVDFPDPNVFNVYFLCAGPANRGRLITVGSALDTGFQVPTDFGNRVPTGQSGLTVTTVTQDLGPGANQSVNDLTFTSPSLPGFALARQSPLPGDFKAFPVAVPQAATDVTTAEAGRREWIIVGSDGIFYYYYESENAAADAANPKQFVRPYPP